ncbi:MAG: DUF2182 domain-containing protein [Acidimicrobiales bacterium]
MSTPTVAATRPTLRISPTTIASLSVAALAWAVVVAIARHMGNGAGTMNLALPAFTGMWALMMAAMMLPAVAPVASLYVRTIPTRQGSRWLLFVAGYLLVWSATAVPAYVALRVVDHASTVTTLRYVAVVVLTVAGIYQLSPLKTACLRHCRSPLAQLLGYGNVTGPAKDLRVSVHHAGYCMGCCWTLMAIMLALGVMNLWVMFAVAAVLLAEKLVGPGVAIGRIAGIVFIAVAAAVAVSPSAASALLPSVVGHMAPGMHGMHM